MSDDDKFQGWPNALVEAKYKLMEGRAFVSRMRNTVKIIERKIADGEEWPGKKISQQKSVKRG